MKIKEIAQKSTPELQRTLAHLREDLRELKFSVSQNQHKDVRDVRELKQSIARVLTVLKDRGDETSQTTK